MKQADSYCKACQIVTCHNNKVEKQHEEECEDAIYQSTDGTKCVNCKIEPRPCVGENCNQCVGNDCGDCSKISAEKRKCDAVCSSFLGEQCNQTCGNGELDP